ncbi:MAG: sensor histidine kinase, partial [Candidatus Dormibacteraceae bacterium]
IQSLIHLCRQLDAFMQDGASEQQREEIADLRALSTGITEDLRRLSKGLRPPSLDDLGLPAAVRRIASDLGRRLGIAVELRVEGQRTRLGRDLELGLFRIAQEALNNAEKHAEAEHVSVVLAFTGRQIRLQVTDDGKGFDAAGDWTRSGSLGLIGMQERATLLGGELAVVTAPGSGTRIVATLPALTGPAADTVAPRVPSGADR